MNTELFVVTGTSGTGKTAIWPILKNKLLRNFRVYDWDEIVRPYDGTGDVWANEVTQAMFKLVKANKEEGIPTVVLGLIKPEWIRKDQEKYNVSKVKFCLLDVKPEVRAQRLKKRGAPEYLIHDLEELNGLPKWIQESGFENRTIDTTNLTLEEVADKIAQWVQ